VAAGGVAAGGVAAGAAAVTAVADGVVAGGVPVVAAKIPKITRKNAAMAINVRFIVLSILCYLKI